MQGIVIFESLELISEVILYTGTPGSLRNLLLLRVPDWDVIYIIMLI